MKNQKESEQEVSEAKQVRACHQAQHQYRLGNRDAMQHHPHHLIVQSLGRERETGSDNMLHMQNTQNM